MDRHETWNIVLFGRPGGGKGTQAAMIAERLGIPHISTGDMFRYHALHQTDLGRIVAGYQAKGELVPDDITNEMVKQRLENPDSVQGYVLDGFPRNVGQAKYLDMISEVRFPIVLDLPELLARDRMLGRGRPDDLKADTVEERLRVFREDTKPILEMYAEKDKLIRVDGTPSIDIVYNNIMKEIGALEHLSHTAPYRA